MDLVPTDRHGVSPRSGRQRADRAEVVRVQAARARIRERDAAFARLSRARTWAIGGAAALSVGFAGVAYAMAPGHKLHTIAASAAGAGTGNSGAGPTQPASGLGPVVQAPSAPPQAQAPAPAPVQQVVVGGS